MLIAQIRWKWISSLLSGPRTMEFIHFFLDPMLDWFMFKLNFWKSVCIYCSKVRKICEVSAKHSLCFALLYGILVFSFILWRENSSDISPRWKKKNIVITIKHFNFRSPGMQVSKLHLQFEKYAQKKKKNAIFKEHFLRNENRCNFQFFFFSLTQNAYIADRQKRCSVIRWINAINFIIWVAYKL